MSSTDLKLELRKYADKSVRVSEVTVDKDAFRNATVVVAGRERTSVLYDIMEIVSNMGGSLSTNSSSDTYGLILRRKAVELNHVLSTIPMAHYTQDIKNCYEMLQQLANARQAPLLPLTYDDIKLIRKAIRSYVNILREQLEVTAVMSVLYFGGVGSEVTMMPFSPKCINDTCNPALYNVLIKLPKDKFDSVFNAENAIDTSNRQTLVSSAVSDIIMNDFTGSGSIKHIYEAANQVKDVSMRYKPVLFILPPREYKGLGVKNCFKTVGYLVKKAAKYSTILYTQSRNSLAYKDTSDNTMMSSGVPTPTEIFRWIDTNFSNTAVADIAYEMLSFIKSLWATNDITEEVYATPKMMKLKKLLRPTFDGNEDVLYSVIPRQVVDKLMDKNSEHSMVQMADTISPSDYDIITGVAGVMYKYNVIVKQSGELIFTTDETTWVKANLMPNTHYCFIAKKIGIKDASNTLSRLIIEIRPSDLIFCETKVFYELWSSYEKMYGKTTVITDGKSAILQDPCSSLLLEVDEKKESELTLLFLRSIYMKITEPLHEILNELLDVTVNNSSFMTAMNYQSSDYKSLLSDYNGMMFTSCEHAPLVGDKGLYAHLVTMLITIPNILRNGSLLIEDIEMVPINVGSIVDRFMKGVQST